MRLRRHQPPTLFLIHGWCCDRSVWARQVAAFEGLMPTVAVDLPGHGSASSCVSDADLSIDGFAAHVAETAAALARGPVVLVGHSMGGPVAIEAAVRLGERCSLVVGVDTFTDSHFYARRDPKEIEQRRKVLEQDFQGEVERMIERIVAPQAERHIIEEVCAMMSGKNEAAMLTALESLLLYDIEARWPRLATRVETINAAALAHPGSDLALEGLAVHAMEKVGHFPMLEAPEAFNALLRSILARAETGVRDPASPMTAVPR